MNFYLDNDVDCECAQVLRKHGHIVITTAEVGMSNAQDDEQTVYAMDVARAVLITHDKRFSLRRRSAPIGQHVRLKCHQMHGPGLLDAALPELLKLLRAAEHMTVIVGPGRRPDDPPVLTPFYGTEVGR